MVNSIFFMTVVSGVKHRDDLDDLSNCQTGVVNGK